MMTASLRTVYVAAVLLLLAVRAKAEILTVEYEAVLEARPLQGWPAGVVISGRYTFNSEDPGNFEDPNVKSYNADHSATIGGVLAIGSDSLIYVWDNHSISGEADLVRDRYQPRATGTVGRPMFDGDIPTFGNYSDPARLEILTFEVVFEVNATNPNALTSLELPLSEADLADFPPDSRKAIVTFASWDIEGDPIAARVTTSGILTKFRFVDDTTPVAVCRGLGAPFEFGVTVDRRDKIIPLRIRLSGFDDDTLDLGPNDIDAPVANVDFLGPISSEDLHELNSRGRATFGNSFFWNRSRNMWIFNLDAHDYTAGGGYLVTVKAPDNSYSIEFPGCAGFFVRE